MDRNHGLLLKKQTLKYIYKLMCGIVHVLYLASLYSVQNQNSGQSTLYVGNSL